MKLACFVRVVMEDGEREKNEMIAIGEMDY